MKNNSTPMARKCEICEKSAIVANPRKLLRGHLNPRGKKRQHPNIQTKTINGRKIKACTKCLKTLIKKAS